MLWVVLGEDGHVAGSNMSEISGCSAACSCLSIHSQQHSDAGKTLAVIAAAQPSNFLPYYSIRRTSDVCVRLPDAETRAQPLAFKFPAFHFGVFGGDWRARARALSYIAPRYARLLHTVSSIRRSPLQWEA